MFTTRVSPQHERRQPSKYFSASRSPISLSPAVSTSERQQRALSSTPVSTTAFMSASSLISKAAIVDHEHKHTQESKHEHRLRNEASPIAEPTAPGKKQGKTANSTANGQNGGVKKRTVKSAEFVLDSDESDTQDGVDIVRSHELGAPTSGSPRERSIYFGGQDTRRNEQVTTGTSTTTNLALARRRSWTPLIDTVPPGPANGALQESPASGPMFADLVSAYQYEGSGLTAHLEMALPPAKKRKATAPKAPKEPKVKATKTKEPKAPKVKAVKVPKPPRVKQPKKKLQTITAMATAPYLPAEIQDAQITIPEALAATNIRVATPIATGPVGVTTTKRKATTTGSAAVKKPRKAAKPKAKVTIREEVPRVLLPPTQAQGSLSNQTFIFGTSSQLHVDESPTTLNQIQLALAESELSPQSAYSHSPIKRSRTKVPTAPHGTSLSIGQANRDLWCVSARDDVGGLLIVEANESQESRIDSVHEVMLYPEAGGTAVDQSSLHQVREEPTLPQKAANDLPSLEQSAHEPVRLEENELADEKTQDDSFVMISSDTVLDDELDALPLKQLLARTTNVTQREYNTSPAPTQPPWPSAQRQVLHPLDANLSIKPQRETFKQARTFASTQPQTTAVQPRRRGRPSKVSQPNAADIVRIDSSPVALIERHTTSPYKILATLQSSPPSEWHNIDEISDSEAPPTPSPPRKRPSASPVVERTLELSGFNEVIEDEIPVSAPSRPPKEGESQWAAVFAKLYPKITSTIRAVPRSDSLTNPTWHEKILLYDPIVIEDLTAWLNTQGLRVTVRRSRAKARKKDAVGAELVEEELSHWMVQKWCEEHSICCLWKEGLRGGVKTRY